jgi:hypothetical protein
MSFELSAIILAWAAIFLLTLALAGVIRQLRALQAAPVTQATRMRSQLEGRELPLAQVGATDLRDFEVLLFLSARCETCQEAIDWANETALGGHGLVVALLFEGRASAGAKYAGTVVEDAHAVFRAFGVPVTPFGVLIDDGRVVAASPLGSRDRWDSLLKGTPRDREPSHVADA